MCFQRNIFESLEGFATNNVDVVNCSPLKEAISTIYSKPHCSWYLAQSLYKPENAGFDVFNDQNVATIYAM
jgi:hypothetical protein